MKDIILPEDYQPLFEILHDFNDSFKSYQSLKNSFDRHIEVKDGNSIKTFLDEVGFKLYQIEWDLWHNTRNEEFINDIILRLNLVIENCQTVIAEIRIKIAEILNSKDEGFGDPNVFYQNLQIEQLRLIKGIKDEILQSTSTSLFVAWYSEKIFQEYLNKFEGFVNKGDRTISLQRLTWLKNDTDFLELITALYESKSINNDSKDLTRKDAISIFSQFFNLEIKDAESKLVRATERKKDTSPFLAKLKQEFDDYCQRKFQE